ncbi:MAG TPA: SMP-30/gluconolactonase/LRE family protein, partial [Rhizomicrobium sp.]|nr:SMP-30/gluconolactonase/LRE family protein [Rhizomicrobium sp.]
EGALYFLDIFGKKVFRHDPLAGTTRSWDTDGHVGAMALRETGGALLAMKDSFYALSFASGTTEKVAGPAFDNPRVTINDGATDRKGRFVFGGCSAGMDDPQPIGGLFSLGTDHRIAQLDSGIYQSNGHCFSPDGKTLYCSDSYTFTTYAYDYDPETGQIAGKRVFANTENLGGRPDGSTVDADGLVWISIFEGAKVAAFRPDGGLERAVDLPVRLISSVAFGGPKLDQLYVTTIDPTQFGWPAEEGSGYLYVIEDLGAQGVSETRYKG